ncbi:MAG: response regulator [Candidatus Latescibacterota bacterium]|jgi:DNA-binding NtrC family response regulator
MNPFSLLFVDDEGDFLSTIEDFFSRFGYTVYTARNGQEALLRLKEHRPNVVFLDISMPHMDGNETLRLVQEVAPETKVVIVSGYASAQLARELLQRGAYDFFQKPVDLVQLQEAVERLRALRELS